MPERSPQRDDGQSDGSHGLADGTGVDPKSITNAPRIVTAMIL
jgi:hypothetical protein